MLPSPLPRRRALITNSVRCWPIKRITPGDVPVWVSSGRWGPRRARVEECDSILRAEIAYGQFVCERKKLGPGWRAIIAWRPRTDRSESWDITAEVVSNAVWRRGRLFLRCPHCARRATRLYVPVAGLQPRCRQCWGLNYGSQSWSYKPIGILGPLLGPLAYATTHERRKRRRAAAIERYEKRRPFLSNERPGA